MQNLKSGFSFTLVQDADIQDADIQVRIYRVRIYKGRIYKGRIKVPRNKEVVDACFNYKIIRIWSQFKYAKI